MFEFWKPKKKPNEFILDENFIVIEFLTEEEKVQKDKIVKKLQEDYAEDFETIIPYETSFKVSTMNNLVFLQIHSVYWHKKGQNYFSRNHGPP